MIATLAFVLLGHEPWASAFSPAGRAVLTKPDRVTIYAVDPMLRGAEGKRDFRWAIAKRRLSPAQGSQVVHAFLASLRPDQSSVLPSCFEPHHGLKIQRGRCWIKAWVCFSCGVTEVQESNGHGTATLCTRSAQAIFDRFVPENVKRLADPEPSRAPAEP